MTTWPYTIGGLLLCVAGSYVAPLEYQTPGVCVIAVALAVLEWARVRKPNGIRALLKLEKLEISGIYFILHYSLPIYAVVASLVCIFIGAEPINAFFFCVGIPICFAEVSESRVRRELATSAKL